MKVVDIWKSNNKPTLSFELFPARSEKAAANLDRAIDKLAELAPDFVSVTFGAGGSTRDGSRELIIKLKEEKGLLPMAYVACYGLGPADLTEVLDSYRELGVENILAVRGDPPHGQETFQLHPESLAHASDFLAFLGGRYDFALGCAGYPEGHIDAEGKERDLEFLKLKVDNGASYIIANYFYDNRYFFNFVERCRAIGIGVPILPGVMPIYSLKMMRMLAKLCGATITDELEERLAALPEGDKDAVLEFGIDYAFNQCKELLKAGAVGLHVYTMDRSKSTAAIVNRLRGEGLL